MLTENEMKTLENLFKKISADDYSRVVNMFKKCHSKNQAEAVSIFNVGDYVYFFDRNGHKISGTITKINAKTIKVKSSMAVWSVSPSLLKK